MAVSPLPAAALYRRCDIDALPFVTTAELEELTEPVGQQRAVAAVRFAIGMRAPGYNLFALGPEGTGKNSLVRRYLTQAAADRPVPDDWIYVNNFEDSHRPRALRLPSGRGPALKKDMETLVEDLRLAIPRAFEGEDYTARKHAIEEQFKDRHDAALDEAKALAAGRGIAVVRTTSGVALAPMTGEGQVLSAEEFGNLPEDKQVGFHNDMEDLQPEIEDLLKQVPQWEREQRDLLRDLDREICLYAVGHLIEPLHESYADLPAVIDYIDAVAEDVVENFEDFLDEDNGEDEEEGGTRSGQPNGWPLRRYKVNVLVNHGETSGAPVVREDNPTQPNLVGRIEHMAQYGALLTDFHLIKAGALHRANGGYLVLDARKLLLQPFAWEDLKRALQSREIRIEMPGESLGGLSTTSLEPEPIPLEIKIVLLGEPMLYYDLSEHDPDFSSLFKVAADFDYHMDRSAQNSLNYARLLGSIARRENLKPLARDAVARIVEHAARLAEDSEKLSTHIGGLADLVREADYWAGERTEVVTAAHVQQAIDAQTFRSDRVREHVLEEIQRGTVMIDTDGEVIGQVNALSVLELGNFMFGRPNRISCRVHLGKGDVIDIEREVDMGGPMHSKGVMILSSFLAARFAQDQPLALSAYLVFEQSYGAVDGDSASSTELYALLSALAEAPIRQSLAVTGSVNQYGRIQPIGGVNEKIEGFFDICKARGLTGDHGVMIPDANVKHLMLRHDVVEAAAAGLFHIYPVETIDQGIEILTGMPAGKMDEKGDYPRGSINKKVASRLALFNRRLRELHAEPRNGGR